MIKAILVFNNHGKPRLTKFYQYYVSILLTHSLIYGFNLPLAYFYAVNAVPLALLSSFTA